MNAKERVEDTFERIAGRATVATGSFWAFALALLTIIVWAIVGPMFGFSEAWQLVINTGTTIVTFLMVFVIQHAQNKETRAIQLKLNELIAALQGSSNRLIDVEDLSERELNALYKKFRRLARDAKRLRPGEKTTVESESDEAKKRQVSKKPRRQRAAH